MLAINKKIITLTIIILVFGLLINFALGLKALENKKFQDLCNYKQQFDQTIESICVDGINDPICEDY